MFMSCRYGFGAYFNILPGSEWSAIMLTYGFPVAVIGMALKVKFIDLHIMDEINAIIWTSISTSVDKCAKEVDCG